MDFGAGESATTTPTRSIGIDLLAIRDRVGDTFGATAFDNALRKSGRRRRRPRMPFTKGAKNALELSLQAALAHNANDIECEHIMLGILLGGDTFTLRLITEHVDVPNLRAEIVELLDQAA